jgi:hypothetical protein
MNSNPQVYYVGGSKGGVGKSLLSFALTDYLLRLFDVHCGIVFCIRLTMGAPIR